MSLFAWALLLVVQNAAFTWVSRARNGGSYSYHALAAIVSNGVFFASQFVLIGFVASDASPQRAVALGAVYMLATTAGSVAMHWASVRWLERGKRKVGAA